jgi:acetyl esterase/lipase
LKSPLFLGVEDKFFYNKTVLRIKDDTPLNSLFQNPSMGAIKPLLFPFSEEEFRSYGQESVRSAASHCFGGSYPEITEDLQRIIVNGEKRTVYYPYRHHQSGLLYYPASHPKGFAVILPGGAYQVVCALGEGFPVARHLAEKGYSSFVVGYRIGKEAAYPAPIEDLREAFEIIFDPKNNFALGDGSYLLFGFSAGGHLAATFAREDIGYRYYGLPRPQALVLGYPVLSFVLPTHAETRDTFLGGKGPWEEALLKHFSVEEHLSSAYPPTFLWRAKVDPAVPTLGADVFASRLEKLGVPLDYEIYPGEGHGWGMGIATPAWGWFEKALLFLQSLS